MVIDHHQLNVFSLIFYTLRHMWSLKGNNIKHFLQARFFNSKENFRPARTANTMTDSHLMCHQGKKRNNKSIRMNFVKVCLYAEFQIKMRAALGVEKQRAANTELCKKKKKKEKEEIKKAIRDKGLLCGRRTWTHSLSL